VGPAFICLLRKVRRQNFQPILQNAFYVLIAPQSLACQKFPDVEKLAASSVLYRECSKNLHLNYLNNSLTIADMPSCIVVRYPFHVMRFSSLRCCLWVPSLSSLLPFNLSLMCLSNGTTHEAPCQAVFYSHLYFLPVLLKPCVQHSVIIHCQT